MVSLPTSSWSARASCSMRKAGETVLMGDLLTASILTDGCGPGNVGPSCHHSVGGFFSSAQREIPAPSLERGLSMRRTLAALVVVLAAAAPGRASGLLIPTEKKLPPLAMLSHQVSIAIDEQVALTRV